MTEGTTRARALDHLYQGQSNDTYWHGLFGGIYISHMRLATYEHLIAAADLAETAAGGLHVAELRDLDLDGHDEVRLAGPGQVVSIDLDEGGGIGGWDLRAVRHNACAVLRRRPEAYHAEAARPRGRRRRPSRMRGGSDAPTSIHEIFLVKEPGLAAMLHYDPYERRSGLVRFLAPGTTPEAWAAAEAVELGDAVDGSYEIETLELDRLVVRRDAAVSIGSDGASATVRVVKTFTLGGDRRSPTLAETVEVTNRSDETVEAILGLEWTLTMLGGGGNPSAWLEVDGERTSHDSHAGGDRADAPGARATTTSGSRSPARSRRRPRSGARRSRRSRTPRPASSASTRVRGCSWAGPSHLPAAPRRPSPCATPWRPRVITRRRSAVS